MAEVLFVSVQPRVVTRRVRGEEIEIVPPRIPAVQHVSAVVGIPGRNGDPGLQGVPGPTGSAADDPGDLTLLFENKLI